MNVKINTFETITSECSDLSQLSDGQILFEIASEVDPSWFQTQIDASQGPELARTRGLQVLKELHGLLVSYFIEVLNFNVSSVENLALDLEAIFQNKEVQETVKLCSLLLIAAVHCARNGIFVLRIQGLSTDIQSNLMQIIEKELGNLNSTVKFVQNGEDNSNALSEGKSLDAFDQTMISNFSVLLKDKHETEIRHRQLVSEFDDLQSKHRHLETDYESLKIRFEKMEISSSKGGPDVFLKSEIERLKGLMAISEEQKHEAELLCEEQAQLITELHHQLEELQIRVQESSKLKDDLQELQIKSEQLAKAETLIERYKKKLDETSESRRQITALEEQNKEYAGQIKRLEDEFLKLSSSKIQIEGYKISLKRIENENEDMKSKLQLLQGEMEKVKIREEYLEGQVSQEQGRVQELEEKLREIEFTSSLQSHAISSTGNFQKQGLEIISSDETQALKREICEWKAQYENQLQLLTKAREVITKMTEEKKSLEINHQENLKGVIDQISSKAKLMEANLNAPLSNTAEPVIDRDLESKYADLVVEYKALEDRHKREQILMSSAWYSLATPLLEIPKVTDSTPTWLTHQKKLISQKIRNQF
jgi:protein HOOK3